MVAHMIAHMIDWLRNAGYDRPDGIRRVLTARVVDHLIPDERVLVATRRHAVLAVWPIPLSLAVLVIVARLSAGLSPGSPLVDLLWWGWFATVAYAGWRLLEWSTDVFVVTDRRVMLFTGFLTRRVAMMPVVKVTDLTYRRTPLGRLLRYGDFVIESAGQDQALHTVGFLPNPHALYHEVTGTLFAYGQPARGRHRDRSDSADTGELDRVQD